MLRLVLCLVLATVAFGNVIPKIPSSPLPKLDGRIVGGQEVDIEDYPYQVSLQLFGSHFCGGTIIDKKWIVTAAHCTAGIVETDIRVRAGSSFKSSGGQYVSVAKVNQHPQYNPTTIDYDIAILELSANIDISKTPKVATLPAVDESIADGTAVKVSGWGTTSEGGSTPSWLRAVDVNTVSLKKCRDAYGADSITDQMLCADVSGGGKDACQGDSGGPLVNKDKKLLGVVSWGLGCARPTHPGVYASVPKLRQFITDITTL